MAEAGRTGFMANDEGLGGFGWLLLLLVVLEVLLVVFWPAGVFYLNLLLGFVVLAALALLCGGRVPSSG